MEAGEAKRCPGNSRAKLGKPWPVCLRQHPYTLIHSATKVQSTSYEIPARPLLRPHLSCTGQTSRQPAVNYERHTLTSIPCAGVIKVFLTSLAPSSSSMWRPDVMPNWHDRQLCHGPCRIRFLCLETVVFNRHRIACLSRGSKYGVRPEDIKTGDIPYYSAKSASMENFLCNPYIRYRVREATISDWIYIHRTFS